VKTITHIFSRYTEFLWHFLKPLGPWGVLLAGALDGSLLGLPVDVVVAGYVYSDRHRFWLYVLMASAGSALGSIVIYLIGYEGGETLLRKRISPERFDRIHNGFDRHPFWSLMFPAMLPPPFPFKILVLAAAVFEMNFAHFLLAIFCGRLVRFLLLSLLTLKFGPHIVGLISALVRRHALLLLIVIAAGIGGWLLWRKRFRGRSHKRRKRSSAQA
jgi:membrane protein YqaA with SNARE-associated domain